MEEGDALTNTFSEEGRIHQVEYAIKNVSSAGSSIGLRFKNGVILLGKSLEPSLLLKKDEKIFRINEHVFALVAGLYADSNLLVNYARVKAQNHLHKYDQDMTPKMVARTLCLLKQGFTQGGGMRPFGASFMISGYVKDRGFQLFSTDPSGTMGEWRSHAFGENDKAVLTVLENETRDELEEEEALRLVFKCVASSTEMCNEETARGIEILLVKEEGGRIFEEGLDEKRISEYLSRAREDVRSSKK